MSNDGFDNAHLLDTRDDIAPTVIILNVLADYIQRAGYVDAKDCLADIETEVIRMCRALQL